MPFALLAIALLNFQAPPAPLLLDKNYKLKGSIFLLTSNQPADYSGQIRRCRRLIRGDFSFILMKIHF